MPLCRILFLIVLLFSRFSFASWKYHFLRIHAKITLHNEINGKIRLCSSSHARCFLFILFASWKIWALSSQQKYHIKTSFHCWRVSMNEWEWVYEMNFMFSRNATKNFTVNFISKKQSFYTRNSIIVCFVERTRQWLVLHITKHTTKLHSILFEMRHPITE